MQQLEEKIKTIAREYGAAPVGIASRQRLLDAPPSGDPGFLLPSTQSVISFAIPYKQSVLREFIGKTDWRSFNLHKKECTQRLYIIGDHLVDFLKSRGFDALAVDINNNYRPEPGAADISEIVRMVPEFSHRYGAVAAGIGRLGWSGNVMTPHYGAAVLLGTVLTSARLSPDPLIEQSPCDRCKMCVASCPVGMIHPKESITVTIAGMTEEIARKRTNNCCWMGCDGYHGRSASGKWTNWSPYRVRTPLPVNDSEMDVLCTELRKADPDAKPDALNIYTNYRDAFFEPDYLFFSVCGHCANICWPNRPDRNENRKILATSGIVALRVNGERSAVPNEADILEIDTPFHRRVALLRKEYEAVLRGKIHLQEDRASTRSDSVVLKSLKEWVQSGG